jgi:hypothetical protein
VAFITGTNAARHDQAFSPIFQGWSLTATEWQGRDVVLTDERVAPNGPPPLVIRDVLVKECESVRDRRHD